MLRTIVGIIALGAIVYFSRSFLMTAEIAQEFEARLREQAKKPSERITLKELANFEFERVVVASTGCDKACLKTAIGFDWSPLNEETYIDNKDYDLWIFSNKDNVVHYRLFPKVKLIVPPYTIFSQNLKVRVFENQDKYLTFGL
jgi:hypothetical protein